MTPAWATDLEHVQSSYAMQLNPSGLTKSKQKQATSEGGGGLGFNEEEGK